MSDFKAKMHKICFPPGLCPRPCWGSLQRSLRPPTVFKGRERKGKGGGDGSVHSTILVRRPLWKQRSTDSLATDISVWVMMSIRARLLQSISLCHRCNSVALFDNMLRFLYIRSPCHSFLSLWMNFFPFLHNIVHFYALAVYFCIILMHVLRGFFLFLRSSPLLPWCVMSGLRSVNLLSNEYMMKATVDDDDNSRLL